MEVNTNAPVIASSEIRVVAPPNVVWDVISDIGGWPTWNSEVKSASVTGPLVPGTSFKWKAGPGSITSTLQEVEAPRTLGWSGRTMGIRALHVYRLEQADGETVVHTSESWEGGIAGILKKSFRRQLQQSLDAGVQALKAEAERRAK